MSIRVRSVLILSAMILLSAILGVSAVAKDEWDIAILCAIAIAVAVCAVITWNFLRVSRGDD